MLGRSVAHSSSKKPVDNVEALPVKRELQYAFDAEEAGVDPVYQAKARILNDAFQEIGMGKYQVSCVSYRCSERTDAERNWGSGTCSFWLALGGSRECSTVFSKVHGVC